MRINLKIFKGETYPLGASVLPGGVNFSLFSKNATAVELLLFDRQDHREPTHIFRLDPIVNKTFYYWHCFISGIGHGQAYGFRVYGPYEPTMGMRFDGQKVLIDPYARAVVSDTYDRQAACEPGDNCATAIKSVVIDPSQYDWKGDRPLYLPFRRTIVYELHPAGFTKHPSSGLQEELRGTYRGLISKIPYLKELGITSVELMPVQQFDPTDTPSGLPNYWGYAPVAFFAPHNGYSSSTDPLEVLDEFRDMVRALHREGIEVILDVVFNHTAEGGIDGPTLGFRGLENIAYYMLEPDQHRYKNYTGTGNTLNANHSIVRRLVRDCLRHWVAEMHVDGFRFDLASVLSRDENGRPLESPPLLWEIESDPTLAPTRIIAEAWDLEQYQLGNFIGDKWAEWNGRFRDDVRRFLRGDEGMVRAFANRIAGSPDLFRQEGRNPHRSINFVTCHDGFTLNDLVSYNEKHNWGNGEENRDGTDTNHSWNFGVEGPSSDPEVEVLRLRQIKNFLAVLMIAHGTPMLLMGDEVRRTQYGNNNAYCQDNEINWFDWSQVKEQAGLARFVKELSAFNMSSPYLSEAHFWQARENSSKTVITWHGTHLDQPDWSHSSHSLAWTLQNPDYDTQVHVMVNAFWEPLVFALPPLPSQMSGHWFRLVDTALSAPADIVPAGQTETHPSFSYPVQARSVVILLAKSVF